LPALACAHGPRAVCERLRGSLAQLGWRAREPTAEGLAPPLTPATDPWLR
jgi:hypothetical protein